MTLVAWLRRKAMAAHVRVEPDMDVECDEGDRLQLQLASFNEQWSGFSTRVPHWAALRQELGLQGRFHSWDEVRRELPVMERGDLQLRLNEMCDPQKAPHQWRATGGSTGKPVRFPIWRSEMQVAAADMWQARSWFGISPGDRAFLIWGHSHLLGKGLTGWTRGMVRRFKDRLFGYRRWSAYRMGESDLREAAKQLLDFRPAYILGYSVALDRFARANERMAPQFRKLGLRAVIATAESFPQSDSRGILQEVLGCPVVMEYGAVESGPVAHERPGGGYRVFWRRYFVEVLPSTTVPGSWELLLTSLYPRCLPLVRYRIGDLVVPESDPPVNPLWEFKAVVGRCNDTILLPHGRRVHSEAMAHVLRGTPITGFQVVQKSIVDLTLWYTSPSLLTESQLGDIQNRLERVDSALAVVRLARTDNLTQTVAGKMRTVCSMMEPTA